ncbi:Arylsulfatase precursor [Pirellulimonas nuda]|uniref:Arylsulfatase n=1 Tax=Pirellulimonas nuda TaxID=2528009 RepID=A0A518D7Y0_9BACT|nr:sulfatase [Pirellulimonas nuda]QDU87574.1 Arylsulfatase precursor [Pirellulimonas nuda]
MKGYFLLFGFLLASVASAADRPPNLVVILADDVGYMDLASYAARVREVPTSELYYETPSLDRMAAEGLSFTQFYVNPLCSPTRASLLTGKWAAPMGFTTATPSSVTTYYNQGLEPPSGYHEQDVVRHRDRIDQQQALLNARTLTALPSGRSQDHGRNEVSLAEALPTYHSAFLGKWHVGGHGALGYQPSDQGFQSLAYYDSGSSPYFRWRPLWSRERLVFSKMRQKKLMWGNPGPETGQEYLTDDLAEQAATFIKGRALKPDQPFLLWFAHFACHAPIEAKPEMIAAFDARGAIEDDGRSNSTYAAMLKSLDQSVGRIMKELRDTGQAENTVVVFLSDNGGVDWLEGGPTSNAPLKGGKATLFEGGIRVPMIVWAPGRDGIAQGGALCNKAVHGVDLYPTLTALAGAKPTPEIDGESFATLLKDPTGKTPGYNRLKMYWHYPFNVDVPHPEDRQPLTPHSAIRSGAYKLIVDWHGRLRLYNIEEDMREEHDLSEKEADRAKRMFAELCDWLDKNVDERYMPKKNPKYDAKEDPREYPFKDLRKELLGKAGFEG